MSTRPSPSQTEPTEIKCQLGVQVREKTLLPDGCGLQVSEPINLAYKKVHWPGCTRKHLPRALKSSRETQLLGLRTTNARSTWAQLENKWPFKGFHVKGIPQCLTSRLARFPSHSAHVKPPLPLLARSASDHVLHQPVSTSDLLANFLFHPFMFFVFKADCN